MMPCMQPCTNVSTAILFSGSAVNEMLNGYIERESGRLECVGVSVEIKRGFKKETMVGEKQCEVSFNGYI